MALQQPATISVAGSILRVETMAPAIVRWTSDHWRTQTDTNTRDTGLGMHLVDLPTDGLGPDASVEFTFRWTEADRWEGRDFAVELVPSES